MTRRILTAREQLEMLSPWRLAAWTLAPHQSVAVNPDNPDLTQLADLPDVKGRWAFPYQGVSHESMGGSKMHSWGVHPTDAPARFNGGGRRGPTFYNPELASISEPDEFGRQRAVVPGRNRVGDIQQAEPGTIWRGMSDEEYKQAQQRGYFESNGAANFKGQEGITCFSDDPDTAGSYASNYAPFQYMPTFSRPGHVIGIPDQGHPRNTVNEIEVPGKIPFSDVTHHYRGDVAEITPGEFGGYQGQPNPDYGYNGFDDKPSRKMSPSISMQWSADHPEQQRT